MREGSGREEEMERGTKGARNGVTEKKERKAGKRKGNSWDLHQHTGPSVSAGMHWDVKTLSAASQHADIFQSPVSGSRELRRKGGRERKRGERIIKRDDESREIIK